MKTGRAIAVGVPTGCLHEAEPRGVVRAARAVAERLAGRRGLRMFAISEPTFGSGELVCECSDLAEWLETHPIRDPGRAGSATPLRRAVGVGRRVLSAVGLERPGRRAYRFARRAVWFAPPPPPPPRHAPAEFVSVRDLDVVLSFECYDPIWQWPLESYGCRMVGVFHDAIPLRIDEGADARPDEYLRAAGLMALRAAVLCCDSESARTDLEAFFPAARARARVVHLGHEAERFRATQPPRRHEGKRIAMIGAIEARKNQAGVLRAARAIAAAWPDERVTLVLVGRTRAPDPLEYLARDASTAIRIERHGYIDDDRLPALLAGCDCFVYPSLWEGFGIPVLEAMSAGVPVVCSDTSALPEVAGPHAFYCDPFEPQSIARAVTRALALSPAERGARAAAARAWAARFTWTATADRFHDGLIECAAGGVREVARAARN